VVILYCKKEKKLLKHLRLKLVRELITRRINMNENDLPKNKGIEAMKESSRIASENGISDMSLDEINAEIAAAREQE